MIFRPVRVLFVLGRVASGGAEMTLLRLLPLLTERGVDPVVCHQGATNAAMAARLAALGVALEEMPRLTKRPVGWFLQYHRAVKRQRPDVVHLLLPLVASAARIHKLASRSGPPIVYREPSTWPAYRPLVRLINSSTFALNDVAFAVSSEVRNSMRPGAQRRTEVLVHGLNVAEFREQLIPRERARSQLGIAGTDPVLITVGSAKASKNYDLLLEVAAALLTAGLRFRWMIIGDGRAMEGYRDRARSAGLEGVVSFVGQVDEAAKLLLAFDLYVCTSDNEGLSVAAMEAMSAGLPVVTTDIGGAAELAGPDRAAAVVVPRGRSVPMSRELAVLLRNSAERHALAERARRHSAIFDLASAADVLASTYGRLADRLRPI